MEIILWITIMLIIIFCAWITICGYSKSERILVDEEGAEVIRYQMAEELNSLKRELKDELNAIDKKMHHIEMKMTCISGDTKCIKENIEKKSDTKEVVN